MLFEKKNEKRHKAGTEQKTVQNETSTMLAWFRAIYLPAYVNTILQDIDFFIVPNVHLEPHVNL